MHDDSSEISWPAEDGMTPWFEYSKRLSILKLDRYVSDDGMRCSGSWITSSDLSEDDYGLVEGW